jgi:hypothetical protein
VTVSKTTDGGTGSLRDAINQVNAGSVTDNTIVVPAGTYQITLPNQGGASEDTNASGDFDIRHNLILNGAGAATTIIDGNGATIMDRVFDVIGNVTVTFSGLTIRNGDLAKANGGGINNASGSVAVTNCVVTNNKVDMDMADGGGIYSNGVTLTITGSTISQNSGGVFAGGGGVAITGGTATITNSTISGNMAPGDKAGGILNDATLTITGSTISGNSAGAQAGGGLVNGFQNAAPTTTITNSTFSGNTAAGGGAIAVTKGSVNLNFVTISNNTVSGTNADGGGILNSGGTVNVHNSLIAANTDQSDPNNFPDVAGAFISQGNNLIGDGTGATGFTSGSNGDQVGTATTELKAQLGPLQNNGGPTFTQALLAGSPAINAASSTGAPATDQRGVARDAKPDIGAYELVQANTMTTLTSTPNPSTSGQAVTFTATVTPTGGATGTPAGTVNFLSGTTTLFSTTLNSTGEATFTTSTLPAGTTKVTAAYAGNTSFAGSTSAAVTQTVSGTTPAGPGNTGFVTQLYADLLGRTPDQSGLQVWVNALNANQLTRTQVAFQFEQSQEYRLRTLGQLYTQLLKRAIDSTGSTGWLSFLQGGGTFEQVEASILASPEYYQVRGGGTVNGYLTALYGDVLHRVPDASGQAAFSAALNQGVGRQIVTTLMLSSPESDMLEVKGMFNQFLRRDPDPSGATAFFNALQAGTSNEAVISIILGSPEYFAKFTT